MALPGELEGLYGATCEGCASELTLGVQHSGAGWYLGYFCGHCGPYSRETGYFATSKEAKAALNAWLEKGEVPANLRDTEYHP